MTLDWDAREKDRLMGLALAEAARALDEDEVPVGAVVVARGTIIGKAHNQREALNDPTAHAEILALRDAAAALSTWRLEDVVLVVTLEPCAMCAGALVAGRGDHDGVRPALDGARGPRYTSRSRVRP